MDKASLVRIGTLIASLLVYFNINIPESTIEIVATVIAGIIALYSAYKNNYLFSKGKKQKVELEKKGLK